MAGRRIVVEFLGKDTSLPTVVEGLRHYLRGEKKIEVKLPPLGILSNEISLLTAGEPGFGPM